MSHVSIGQLWRILFDAWILGEVAIALGVRTRRSQGSLRDRGTKLLIWAVIVGSFFLAGWLQAVHPAPMPFPERPLRLAALSLLIAGLLVRILAILTLGRSFSTNVAIRGGQSIQRSGLYRVVRHPSYLGMEIIFLAAGLYAHDWLSLAILVMLPTLVLLYRIHVEEAALLDAIGSEYTDYMRSTKRLIPGVY